MKRDFFLSSTLILDIFETRNTSKHLYQKVYYWMGLGDLSPQTIFQAEQGGSWTEFEILANHNRFKVTTIPTFFKINFIKGKENMQLHEWNRYEVIIIILIIISEFNLLLVCTVMYCLIILTFYLLRYYWVFFRCNHYVSSHNLFNNCG